MCASCFQVCHTCGPMAIPRGGFILIGPPMLGCPVGTDAQSHAPTATHYTKALRCLCESTYGSSLKSQKLRPATDDASS